MTHPLRKVQSTMVDSQNRVEILECGHRLWGKGYKKNPQPKARRCRQCTQKVPVP